MYTAFRAAAMDAVMHREEMVGVIVESVERECLSSNEVSQVPGFQEPYILYSSVVLDCLTVLV